MGGQRHAPADLLPGEAGWAPGPVWTGAENLAHNGIRYPDSPARSQSLYLLSYPGPQYVSYLSKFDFKTAAAGCELQSINPHNVHASRTILHECLYDLHLLGERNSSKIRIYRVSHEEWTKLRESVPYVELYRYNPKHLYPKLNGYGDNGQRSLKL